MERILTSYGIVRPDMGEGCPERIDFDFLKWVWTFNSEHRERFYRMLNKANGIEAVVLKNRRQARRFLPQFDGQQA